MLECVVNISEGRDTVALTALARAAGPCLLDVHRDADHHRSVFTLAGPGNLLDAGVRSLATKAVALIDLRHHHGAHPRMGVVDVVPWVTLTGWPIADGPIEPAIEARDRFARWAGANLQLPCFTYGPERSLPDLRRMAWATARPDTGPSLAHPTAGAAAVGARPLLVAYNLWLAEADLDLARTVAVRLRGPAVRALGLQVGSQVQVSCNLIDPVAVGPAAVFDAVASRTDVARAELIGLVTISVLQAAPRSRWAQLDLDASRTLEARLEEAGFAPW